MDIGIYNYNNYKGGVDIFTVLLKKELERHYNVNVELNNNLNKDIIHNHNVYNGINSDVLTMHSLEFNKLYENKLYDTLDNAKIITCITKYQKDYLKREYGIKCKRYIYNFSDALYYPMYPMPHNKKLTVGYFGRIEKDKGIDDIITLSKLCPNVDFLLCGHNQDNYNFKPYKNIKYVPHIYNREAYFKLIDMVDLVIHPSYKDVCPISIIDCMFRNKPIIARNIEPLKYVFRYIHYYDDLKEVIELLNSDDLYKYVGKCFNYAYIHFNPLNSIMDYYKLYYYINSIY